MTLEEFIKKEMKLLDKLKKVLEKEMTCLKERDYKSYKKIVTRKEEVSKSLEALLEQKQMFFPCSTVRDLMLQGEESMELAVKYLDLVNEVKELNESIDLLTKMEQAFAKTFVETIERSATGEKTYGATGEYESSIEVDSTIINRSF